MKPIWETRFKKFLLDQCLSDDDSAHDYTHIQRVVTSAKMLARLEKARPAIVFPAAWLHDCVAVAKDHPDRSKSSTLAAERAVEFLQTSGYEPQYLEDIHHAIQAHSFSAGITPETVEAKVVQDSDRLDALGAIGIARCFMVGGKLGRALYQPDDPFCQNRAPDDKTWTIDHFYQKLFKLPGTMQTDAGKQEAERRVRLMKTYLNALDNEIK